MLYPCLLPIAVTPKHNENSADLLFSSTSLVSCPESTSDRGACLLSRYRPNAYFDPSWYREQNAEVQRSDTDPLLHYIQTGERERRRPMPHFDPAWYCTTYGLAEGESALRHFLQRRHTGEVSPIAEFDAAWYLQTYRDVAAAGIDPTEHYMVQGYKEARNP